MEAALAVLSGFVASVAVWLMLTGNLVRFLFGLTLVSNAVNLAIFAGGRLSWAEPPLSAAGSLAPAEGAANALPQALILTAIVISFGLFAFALALTLRAHALLGSVEPDAQAEPPDESRAP
jgi:multicomponent Na+:H+ antiporter subunit C